MPQAISPDRQMVARFGSAAVAAGLLTPAIAARIAECNRLIIVYVAVEASHVATVDDGRVA